MKCTDCKLFKDCRGSMQIGTNCFIPKEKEYDITSESAFHNYDLGYEEGYERGKKEAVVHAHWIDFGIRCSSCGKFAMDEYNYCPHCGAKMDEEVQE